MASRRTWRKTLRDIGKKLNEQKYIMATFQYADWQSNYDFAVNQFLGLQTSLGQATEDVE